MSNKMSFPQKSRVRPLSMFIILMFVGLSVGIAQAKPIKNTALQVTNLRDFQLLSESSGWVIIGERLFWTSDSAQTWQDITPLAGDAELRTVHFIDSLHGWAAYTAANGDAVSYTVFATQDGGSSWEASAVAQLPLSSGEAFSSSLHLFFSGEQTGWLAARTASSSNFNFGILYHTADGGRTWERLELPLGEKVFFQDTNNGWVSGRAIGEDLFHTADGGSTWDAQSVADIALDQRPIYYLPAQSSSGELLLPVITTAETDVILTIFHSADAGQSWENRDSKVIAEGQGTYVPFAAAGDMLFFALPDQLLGYDAASAQFNAQPWRLENVGALQMASNQVGWAKQQTLDCTKPTESGACSVLTSLLKTQDGGNTWLPLYLPVVAESPFVPPQYSSGEDISALALGDRTGLFEGQAFDRCDIPTLNQLGKWYTHSPYKAVNLYFGGANRGCKYDYHNNNTLLSSAFLYSASSQGWKFIPTWVGLQAPCTTPDRYHVFSYDPTTAYQEGLQEADSALTEALRLGLTESDLSGTVIYFDLEAFDSGDSACVAAAQSFINGWSDRLNENGSLSGVYGSTCASALSQMADISNPPDAIWLAHWYPGPAGEYYNPDASVWDTLCVGNSLWPDHQRIRQYTGGHDETWGPLTLTSIDSNVADGIVADLSGVSVPALLNESFETAFRPPWEFLADNDACQWEIGWDGSIAYKGVYFLSVNENNNNPDCSGFYQDIPFAPVVGNTYRFAIWARSADANPRDLSIALAASGGVGENAFTQYIDIGAEWTCVETALVIANPGHDSIRAEILLQSDDSTNYYFDYAQFSQNAGTLCPKPVIPTKVSASDGEFLDAVHVTWQNDSRATYYEIFRSSSPGGTRVKLGNSATAAFDDTTAIPGITYYYWVKACNNAECSEFSGYDDGYRGYTDVLPTQPTLSTPTGTITEQSPTYSWSELSNATRHLLVVKKNGTDVVTWKWTNAVDICTAGTCAVIPGKVLGAGDYTWWVVGENAAGFGPWSLPGNFTLEGRPDQPALYAPDGTIFDQTPAYSWEDVYSAEDYLLVVRKNETEVVTWLWSAAGDICTAGTCEVDPGKTLGAGSYTFWVIGRNSSYGFGFWSLPNVFTIEGTPDQPALYAPTGTISDPSPEYSWEDVYSAEQYVLVVKDSGNNVEVWTTYNAIDICSGSSCAVTPAGVVLPDDSYTWLVLPKNSYGNGFWSLPESFTVSTP